MDGTGIDRETLLIVLLVAAAAPIIADLPKRVRVSGVVLEILLGILVGPQVLGIAEPDALTTVMSDFGLAALFFLAGMEIDMRQFRERSGRRATTGWLLSLLIGVLIGVALWEAGAIGAPVLIGLALTTTALGALVPILRDAGLADRPFGRHVLGIGAIGELGPILMLSVILAVRSGELWRTLLLLVFIAAAILTGLVATRAHPARIVRLVETTMHASGQLAVRLAILLLAGLVLLAGELGLDLVLGAFTAGLIAGLVLRDRTGAEEFHTKFDAVGYGFLVPMFFIATGLTFDLDALLASATTILLVPGFALLFVLVRGLPSWLLEDPSTERRERVAIALMSATALPLIVAITEIAVDAGELEERYASALVGAGMLSLIVFPLLATALVRPAGAEPPPDAVGLAIEEPLAR